MLSFGDSAVFMMLVYVTKCFQRKGKGLLFLGLKKKERKVTPQNCVLGRPPHTMCHLSSLHKQNLSHSLVKYGVSFESPCFASGIEQSSIASCQDLIILIFHLRQGVYFTFVKLASVPKLFGFSTQRVGENREIYLVSFYYYIKLNCQSGEDREGSVHRWLGS